MGWAYLVLGGLFETTFAIMLKESHGFSRLWPSLAFVAAAAISFGLLTAAMRTIPVGTAYAVWTGIGAAGTVLVGIVLYAEPATLLRLFFLSLLIVAILGLQIVSE